jgi:uncharacterized protein
MDTRTGWCRGCYRTIDEIVRWGQAHETDKQIIWNVLPQRHQQAGFPEAQFNKSITKADR